MKVRKMLNFSATKDQALYDSMSLVGCQIIPIDLNFPLIQIRVNGSCKCCCLTHYFTQQYFLVFLFKFTYKLVNKGDFLKLFKLYLLRYSNDSFRSLFLCIKREWKYTMMFSHLHSFKEMDCTKSLYVWLLNFQKFCLPSKFI